ncbi:Fanconi anemia group D2 protein isoform X4 [Formica exsecta]|uniref:Fanconi anemia group D2 protein isoform X4 n=1 Tax=Formica exsecta TaxID=72781 RepID=UPI0011423332|nr:Fanconi anemia group D2 protein isoform X4 [Formica exsecta]
MPKEKQILFNMDKRKLIFNTGLHKNLQPISQSLERTGSITTSNKQTSPHAINIAMQEKFDLLHDGNLSDIRSSKSLNNQSIVKNRSCIENKEINFCETEKDILKKNNFSVANKLLKTKALISKQLNSQILENISATSQQDNNHLSGEGISITSRSLHIANHTVGRKRKITCSPEEASDSDLDFLYNERTVIKKKRNEILPDRNSQHVAQNINHNHDFTEKKLSVVSKSSVKPNIKSSISQKKQQDKYKESVSSTELKKYRLNKDLEECRINTDEYFSKKQDFYVPPVFSNFLQKCGITISNNGIYILNVPSSIAKWKMRNILNSKQCQKKDIIGSIEEYVRNEESFEKMLNDMELSIDNRSFSTLNKISLARILLEVTEIQADIYNIFISKLNESILLLDTPEKISWAVPLLHQFRFLDTITNVGIVTTNIEQLLETCPSWFQYELILFLPDILSDIQHQNIAEILTKMLEENCELTNVVLNCIASFNLDKEYLEDYKIKVLHLLKTNMKVEFIPIVIRFLLNNYICSDIVKQMLLILRNIEMQPLAGDKVEECYKNQVQIIQTLKMCMSLDKDVTYAAIMVVKDINKNPKPLDLIILLLVFSGTTRQKTAEVLLKQNIRCGFYRISLLHTLYNDYKEVIRELQPSILQLASKLLKSEEHVFINFAIEWFRLQFFNQKGALFKQREIIEKIILLMGNNDQTVKHAMTILCKMAENMVERDCLVSQCNHLRILLEKIDCFGLEEIGTLSDLLHQLCLVDNSTLESLRDDLFILLQKQLSTAKPLTKCKGVMGAVMAIKHLAGKTESCDKALKLFNKVMKSVKNCSKSQPLFYDQLAQVIAETETININFLHKISNCIEDEFVNTYMTDKPQSSEDLIPKFGLNNAEHEPENYVLNFGNKRNGPIAPILFRLLKTCCMKTSIHGELEAIDALLGCKMLMPQNFDIPEPPILDLIICSINWLREIITGFVTQTDPLLREQVLKRLDTLIYLQGELNMLLILCDTNYQPPPCYFHYFPLPQFVKIEKKSSKKGKKPTKGNKLNISINIEDESREISSTLCSKNPAYFRKFDAKIAHLLDVKIDSPESETKGISIKQVCFLVRELLAIFENEPSESFVKDLIQLLPKICSKLDDVVGRLRQDNTHEFKKAAKLLLCLLTKIFNWKGFLSVTYNTLLRAGQINAENARLRSCKELVAESYKYFESLSDIVTEISLATALVNMCQSLMKHSETYTQHHKTKHAKLAYGFLCLEWPEDKYTGPQYRLSIIQLLNNWIDNEPSPLDTVTLILEWLPDEVSNFENIQNVLTRMPSLNKNIFHLLYKKLFDGLIKGINISLSAVNSDPKRIKIWHNIASNVQKLVQICKILKTNANIQLFLRYMPLLTRQFLNIGMPILEHNLKYQTDDVTSILKMMQGGTRYLHAICCDCTEKKNLPLTKYVPAAKSTLEKLIYSVKGMLVLNDSAAAFWMGNLVNKNLEGREILSQVFTSSEETTLSEINAASEELINASSEILDSDLGEDPIEETDIEDNDIDDL